MKEIKLDLETFNTNDSIMVDKDGRVMTDAPLMEKLKKRLAKAEAVIEWESQFTCEYSYCGERAREYNLWKKSQDESKEPEQLELFDCEFNIRSME
jgi:hypothetical protein